MMFNKSLMALTLITFAMPAFARTETSSCADKYEQASVISSRVHIAAASMSAGLFVGDVVEFARSKIALETFGLTLVPVTFAVVLADKYVTSADYQFVVGQTIKEAEQGRVGYYTTLLTEALNQRYQGRKWMPESSLPGRFVNTLLISKVETLATLNHNHFILPEALLRATQRANAEGKLCVGGRPVGSKRWLTSIVLYYEPHGLVEPSR